MIRFGIVGTGRISDWILKGALQDSRFKAVAVCSRKEETARAFIARHPEVFGEDAMIFTSVQEMAESDAIDAIYIGTPNNTHCSYSLACLEEGKHVICEKPLGCNPGEVEMMIQTSRKSGKALMEAMISTLNPNFLAAREKIKEIGHVRQYSSYYCQYSSRYEDFLKGLTANSFNPKMGGGALQDIGIYTTYPLIVLFGEPQKVKANLIKATSEFGDVDIHGNVSLSYPDMTANLSFSKAADSYLPTEICGEKGNVILDRINIPRETRYVPHAIPMSGKGPEQEQQTISKGLEYNEYYYEFKEFIDIIEKGAIESEINSHSNSLKNAKLINSILSDS